MGDPSSHPDISFHDKTAILVSMSTDERPGGDVCKIPRYLVRSNFNHVVTRTTSPTSDATWLKSPSSSIERTSSSRKQDAMQQGTCLYADLSPAPTAFTPTDEEVQPTRAMGSQHCTSGQPTCFIVRHVLRDQTHEPEL